MVALLELWRGKGKALSTIRSEWSVLRAWAAAIERSELVGPLTAYWNERPRQRRRLAPAGSSARHSDITLLKVLEARSEPTHYWVERVCAVLHVTVHEALTMDFAPVLRFLDGRRSDHLDPKLAAAVTARPQEAHALVVAVRGYLLSSGREHLLWPRVDPSQAARRHANHLAYRRRQLRNAAEHSSPLNMTVERSLVASNHP